MCASVRYSSPSLPLCLFPLPLAPQQQQQQQRFPPIIHRSISSPTSYTQMQGTGSITPSTVGAMDPTGLMSRDQNPLSSSSAVPGTPPPMGTIVSSGTTVGISNPPTSLQGSGGTVNTMKGTTTAPGSNANTYLNRDEVQGHSTTVFFICATTLDIVFPYEIDNL